jgi:hypothetical protein
LRLVLRIGFFVALYVVLEKLLVQVARLPEHSYGRGFILAELVRRLFELAPASILPLAARAAAVVISVRTRSLGPPWSSFQAGPALRALILLMAFVLTWACGTYDYNSISSGSWSARSRPCLTERSIGRFVKEKSGRSMWPCRPRVANRVR